MNTGIFVMGVLLIILLVTPFVFFRDTKRKSKEKELFNSLRDLARRNNSTFTDYKIWNNSAIGIDKYSHLLVFVFITEKNAYDRAINLNEVTNCKVVITSHTIKIHKETNKVTDVIAIALEPRNRMSPDIILEFYNNELDSLVLDEEFQLANEWAKTINTVINSKKYAKSA